MKRHIAAIVLVLSLAAGRLSAAVADGKLDTIRLPSHGLADELATASREIGGEKKRPWKCCDKRLCFRPGGKLICSCVDQVDHCEEACKDCQPVFGDPSKHICITPYAGDPGPKCTSVDGNSDMHEEKRPWKCCDEQQCRNTRHRTSSCVCRDEVDQCDQACTRCEVSSTNPSKHICRNMYRGDPAPRCTND